MIAGNGAAAETGGHDAEGALAEVDCLSLCER